MPVRLNLFWMKRGFIATQKLRLFLQFLIWEAMV